MTDPTRCRLTGAPLSIVLDLGRQPLGNGFLSEDELADEYFYNLACGFSEDSKLFQLIEQPAPQMMFHDEYAFYSSTSKVMKQHFKEFADDVRDRGFMESPDPLIVELGSNDGIFLRHFSENGVRHLGIEPSGAVADVAANEGISVVKEFFSTSLAQQVLREHGPADVIMSANVMCHIPDIRDIAAAVNILLADHGVLVFEDPYLGDVIRLGSYDQIYDEHVFLFSALSVAEIFGTAGLELIDVVPQTTHGGSMRYYLGRRGRHSVSPRVASELDGERHAGLHLTQTFVDFSRKVRESAQRLKTMLEKCRAEGLDLAAYGATSKSTTVYNYAGIGPDLITRVFDNTPIKQGKLTPGMHIPVMPEGEFLALPPDVAFLGAWNHQNEIRTKNRSFEQAGGRWMTHVPEPQFLS